MRRGDCHAGPPLLVRPPNPDCWLLGLHQGRNFTSEAMAQKLPEQGLHAVLMGLSEGAGCMLTACCMQDEEEDRALMLGPIVAVAPKLRECLG